MNRYQFALSTPAVVLGLLLAACGRPEPQASSEPRAPAAATPIEAQPQFSAARIRADMAFLADDLLAGRRTGTDGYLIAANFVRAQYQQLGLQPSSEGSHYQQVPFGKALLDTGHTRLELTLDGKRRALKLGEDYFTSGDVKAPLAEASGDIVFVGYGVHAPDLGYDDLDGVDLEGKIALYLTGAPQGLHTEIRAYHRSGKIKSRELAKRGAVGRLAIMSLADQRIMAYDEVVKRYLGDASFDWIPRPGQQDEAAPLPAAATLSPTLAAELFAAAGIELEAILTMADTEDEPQFEAGALPASAAISLVSTVSEPVENPNVLGLLEGSDPALRNEVIVLSAHLDHIGVKPEHEGEDKIFNGAMDNASGVAVMLEVARAFIETGIRPRRSILFAALAAEEEGLLGAEYLAKFAPLGERRIVGNVNLDMPVLLYDFSDVVAFGAERSSIGPMTAEAVAAADVKLSPDPMPEQGLFTRSDHYRFVEQGVPAVFLVTGFGPSVDGKDGGKVFTSFIEQYYHQPGDSMDLPIDFEVAAKFARINWLILRRLADADQAPAWVEGDFFGQTFSGK